MSKEDEKTPGAPDGSHGSHASGSSGAPRSPADEWRAVRKTALGPEARELEEATDEEIDRELREAGLDPESVAAEGNALAARLLGELETVRAAEAATAAPAPAPLRPEDRVARALPADVAILPVPSARGTRLRWPLLLIAAVVAAAAGTTALTIARRDPDPEPPMPFPVPTAPPEPPPTEVAAHLRQDAAQDFDDGAWQPCLDKLDRALALDPAGDTSAVVREMRAGARAALLAEDSRDAAHDAARDGGRDAARDAGPPSNKRPPNDKGPGRKGSGK